MDRLEQGYCSFAVAILNVGWHIVDDGIIWAGPVIYEMKTFPAHKEFLKNTKRS